MPQFSEEDINAAKRRVQEMRNRVSKFTADEQEPPSPTSPPHTKNKTNNENSVKQPDVKAQEQEEEQDKNKSFFVILALIMLLSKEGADNTLILALLYLLL
ncbi:MAG: hypothetical protein K2L19_08095 [Eubacterium sp.]|nr:hypothetical protein [Eubacterium sp.]